MRDRYERSNPRPYEGLATGTVGALSELIVATDLLMRGVEVFRALSPSASCDLVVLNGRVLRVEVRTGRRSSGGSLIVPKQPIDEGRSDVFAVVLYGEVPEVLYLDPVSFAPSELL